MSFTNGTVFALVGFLNRFPKIDIIFIEEKIQFLTIIPKVMINVLIPEIHVRSTVKSHLREAEIKQGHTSKHHTSQHTGTPKKKWKPMRKLMNLTSNQLRSQKLCSPH